MSTCWLSSSRRTSWVLSLADMENDLTKLVDGRKVDSRTQMDLSRYFRDEVVRNAQVASVEP